MPVCVHFRVHMSAAALGVAKAYSLGLGGAAFVLTNPFARSALSRWGTSNLDQRITDAFRSIKTSGASDNPADPRAPDHIDPFRVIRNKRFHPWPLITRTGTKRRRKSRFSIPSRRYRRQYKGW